MNNFQDMLTEMEAELNRLKALEENLQLFRDWVERFEHKHVSSVFAQAAWHETGRLMKMSKNPVCLKLACPNCYHSHVDEGEWATTRLHKTHLCENCGNEWRPYEFYTVGVKE